MAAVDCGSPQPDGATSPAEFVELLERLKDQSGRTYRQLEEQAATQGDFLPRSTIADALRREALPRPELVAAFVRACGGGAAEVDRWLAARERIAAGGPETAAPDLAAPPTRPVGTPQTGSGPGRSWWWRWIRSGRASARWIAVTAVAVSVAAIAVVTRAWTPGGGEPATGRTAASDGPEAAGTAGASAPPLAGWVRLHPARTPELCVTEGYDRAGQYGSAVAVQRPCAQSEPPKTTLEPAHDGLYFIKWDHPQEGVGCLTVRVHGTGQNLVEPWDDCRASRPEQLFRIEPVVPDPPGRYRLRPEPTGTCLGIKDDALTAGAEVVREDCTGGADQEFLIELPQPGG